jgi:hypothetical protein
MTLKDKTTILLIDFEGHPILGDDYMNELRYACLNGLIYGMPEDKINNSHRSFLIMSDNHDKHPKTTEVEKMARADGQHDWITFDADAGYIVSDIQLLAAERGYNIKKLIIGGCNTAGCVLRSTGYSAIEWAKAGHDVTIYLPMCGEYQIGGINSADKNMLAFTTLYKVIKKEGLMKKITIERFLIEDELFRYLNPLKRGFK